MLDSPRSSVRNKTEAHHTSPPRVARVLIVDDHPAAREGLAYRLGLEPDFEVCGEAADMAEALRTFNETAPDVIVVDLGLRRGDGLDLIARLKSHGCTAKMLVWSWRSESLYAERSLRAGASGYIGKDEATSTIITALHRILAGDVYLSPEMMKVIVRRNVAGLDKDITPDSLGELSNRELEVFQLTGQGLDTIEVGVRLRISHKTVETYKSRIKEKLGLESGSDLLFRAMRWVIENG